MKRLGLLLLVACLAPACASVSRLNQSAEQFTRDAIAQSEANRCTVHPKPCLTDEQFRNVNIELNKVAVTGREFTKLEIAGKATVQDASHFLAMVSAETSTLSQVYTDGAIKTVLDALTALQAKITAIIGKL